MGNPGEILNIESKSVGSKGLMKGFMHLLVSTNTHNTHHYNFEPNMWLLKDI